MTQPNINTSPLPEPIVYADSELSRRLPLITAVAIVSICIARLSGLGNGLLGSAPFFIVLWLPGVIYSIVLLSALRRYRFTRLSERFIPAGSIRL
jgi:hypothetical protein